MAPSSTTTVDLTRIATLLSASMMAGVVAGGCDHTSNPSTDIPSRESTASPSTKQAGSSPLTAAPEALDSVRALLRSARQALSAADYMQRRRLGRARFMTIATRPTA